MTQQPQAPRPENHQLAKIIELLQVQIDDAPQMLEDILGHMRGISEQLAELVQAVKTLASLPASPQPASLPASSSAPVTVPVEAPYGTKDFLAETLVISTDDNGKEVYKIKGFPYHQHGVRVFPEVLPLIGVDPLQMRPGPNPLPVGLIVRALLNENGNPRKIIGTGSMAESIAQQLTGSPTTEGPEEPPFESSYPF